MEISLWPRAETTGQNYLTSGYMRRGGMRQPGRPQKRPPMLHTPPSGPLAQQRYMRRHMRRSKKTTRINKNLRKSPKITKYQQQSMKINQNGP